MADDTYSRFSTEKDLTTANLSGGGRVYSAQAVSNSDDELPDTAKSLPGPAHEIFVTALRGAKSAGADPENAYRTAWGEVKKRYRRKEDGEWVEKAVLMADGSADTRLPQIIGQLIGDADHLCRQLVVDGYTEAADLLKSGMYVDAFNSIPPGYRETIMGRYFHARKDATETTEEFEISVAFKAVVPEHRITYGEVYPVYDPTRGEADLQKEWAKPEIIEDAAHEFLAKWRQQDTFHNEQSGAGEPVESFIAPCDIHEFHGQKLSSPIRRGSWIMATRWTPEAWEMVKSGKIRGYSIGGFKRIRR